MNEQRKVTRGLAAAALAGMLWTAPAAAFPMFQVDSGLFLDPVEAIEYYHAERDQYFVTTMREEIDTLDSGAIAGWARTSQQPAFYAFNDAVRALYVPAAQARAKPVCRFFIAPASHFLSVSKTECEAIVATYPEFKLETADAFYAWEASATGECPRPFARIGGFVFQPIYRLWNARGDTNHRFTASKAERDALVERGWVSEGYGDDGVAMCAPFWSINY